MSVAVVVADAIADEISAALDAAGHRARPGHPTGLDDPGHGRAGQRRQGPRARRRRRRRAGPHRRVARSRACAPSTSPSPARPSGSSSSTPSRSRSRSPPASPRSSTPNASPPRSADHDFGRCDDVGVSSDQESSRQIDGVRAGRRRGCAGCCRPCRRRPGGAGRRRCASSDDRPVELEQLVGATARRRAGRRPDHVDAGRAMSCWPSFSTIASLSPPASASSWSSSSAVDAVGDELGGRWRVARWRRPWTSGSTSVAQPATAAIASARLTDARRVRPVDAGTHTLTRMRALANAPTPTWRPSISTVIVPSGDAAVIVPACPAAARLLEELEQPGRELELLGDPADRERLADVDRRQRRGGSARRSRSRGSGCRAGTWSGCRAGGPSPPRRPRSSRAPTCRPRGGPRPTTASACR